MKRIIYVAGCVMTMVAVAALAATPEGGAAPAAKVAPAAKAPAAVKAAPSTKAAPAAKFAPPAKVAAEPPVTPVTNISAVQIVEKNVAARGGLAAWRAVNTLTMSGELDAGGRNDVKLPFVMTMKRPHKNRFELRVAEQTAVQVYDGKEGWKYRPFLGRDEVESLTPAEAKSAAMAWELDGPLVDYAAKGTKVALMGAQKVEDKNTYKLKLTLKDGTQRHLWVDAQNFLEVKMEGDSRNMAGKMRSVGIYYRDYKTEKGLAMPRVLETAVVGIKQTSKINIQSVAINQPVDDARFAKPQLIAKASAK